MGQYQDPRVVPTDVEDLVALQVQVAVEGLGEYLPGATKWIGDLGRAESQAFVFSPSPTVARLR